MAGEHEENERMQGAEMEDQRGAQDSLNYTGCELAAQAADHAKGNQSAGCRIEGKRDRIGDKAGNQRRDGNGQRVKDSRRSLLSPGSLKAFFDRGLAPMLRMLRIRCGGDGNIRE